MINKVAEFHERLNEALIRADMKPVDLARATELSESTISQYRSGYAAPKGKRLAMIANALSVDPSWLMGIDVPMQGEKNYAALEDDANLITERIKDRALSEALKVYFKLPPDKKQFVIDTIYALGKMD